MTDVATTSAAGSPAHQRVVIQPSRRRLSLRVDDLWRYRELLFFLVWRDVKVRYKQTVLGVGWALLQPVAAMLIFSLIFGRFAKIPSEGVPYPVFVFSGLLVWNYFAQALGLSGSSLVSNSNLVTKVFFPRLIIPFSAIVVPLVDFCLALLVLGGLMVGYGIEPTWQLALLPVFLLLAVITAAGIGLVVSALTVRYRDVIYTLPFVIQLWLFATPVVYPLSLVSGSWQWVLAFNPMSGIIDGARWAILGRGTIDLGPLAVSVTGALLAALIGIAYFKRVERHFADVI